jgi:hypothetical protein
MSPGRPKSDPRALGRRIVIAGAVALLLLCGPAHLWHHAACDDESGPIGHDSHQCVLCSIFAHSPFIDPGVVTLSPDPVSIGVVVLSEPIAIPSVILPRSHARAPPYLLG